jgi:hypothetical protein
MIRRVAAVALLLLSACVIARPRNDTGPIRDRAGPDEGMIIGHLRFPGHEIQGIRIYEEGTSSYGMESRAQRAHVFPDGDFVFENLKPASYRILCFYSGGITYAVMNYRTKDDPGYRHEVKPGAITYVGSLVVGETATDLTLSRVERPRPQEILERLLPRTAGTSWERTVQERLAARR